MQQREDLELVIARVLNAIRAEADYRAGRISQEVFGKQAPEFVACSHPLNDGGDFVCAHCASGAIVTALTKYIEASK